MIRRIVHMEFDPEHIDAFLAIFEASCEAIRAFPGCRELTLLQQKDAPNRMTTYSLWDSEDALEDYRQSDLFRSTWTQTKVLFAARPTAASYDIVWHGN